MDAAAAVDEEAAVVSADVPDVSGNTHGDDKGDDNDDKNGEDDGNDPCPHVDAEVKADAKVAGPEGRRQRTNTDRLQ